MNELSTQRLEMDLQPDLEGAIQAKSSMNDMFESMKVDDKAKQLLSKEPNFKTWITNPSTARVIQKNFNKYVEIGWNAKISYLKLSTDIMLKATHESYENWLRDLSSHLRMQLMDKTFQRLKLIDRRVKEYEDEKIALIEEKYKRAESVKHIPNLHTNLHASIDDEIVSSIAFVKNLCDNFRGAINQQVNY